MGAKKLSFDQSISVLLAHVLVHKMAAALLVSVYDVVRYCACVRMIVICYYLDVKIDIDDQRYHIFISFQCLLISFTPAWGEHVSANHIVI